jgi:hypothetical protein
MAAGIAGVVRPASGSNHSALTCACAAYPGEFSRPDVAL